MNVVEAPACLNCGSPLTGSYCAHCGQKRPQTDLTLRELLHETTRELLNWDGKIPNTLKALFFRPGLLTVDFLAGRRARWLPPLRVYLICSIAFFVSKPVVEAITHRSAREIAGISVTSSNGGTALTPEELQELEAGMPARLFGRDRLLRAAANSAQLNREIDAVFPKAMFVLLPIFALLTMLAWRRRVPHYPAHLYLALHLHAAVFAAFTVLTIALGLFTSNVVMIVSVLTVFSYLVWYGLLTLRRIFNDPWLTTIVKAASIAVVYAICLSATSLLMLGYAVMKM